MTAPSPADRLHAAARQLAAIHRQLREDLARLRADARVYGAGGPPPVLAADLGRHCIAFCDALRQHHTSEDLVFPYLDEEVPELRPVLTRLRADHAAVAELLAALRRLVEDPAAYPPGLLASRLDEMAAELDEHFRIEEASLVPAILALP